MEGHGDSAIDEGKYRLRGESGNVLAWEFHSFRQGFQDYQDFFGLVWLYPVDPVRKLKVHAVHRFRVQRSGLRTRIEYESNFLATSRRTLRAASSPQASRPEGRLKAGSQGGLEPLNL